MSCKIKKNNMYHTESYQVSEKHIEIIENASLNFSDASEEYYKVIESMPNETYSFSNEGVYLLKKNAMGLLCLEVKIEGKTYDFILDTGAQVSCISKALTSKIETRHHVSVGASDGVKKDMSLCSMNELEVLGTRIENLPMLILEEQLSMSILGLNIFKVDGIIGWDVLSRFDMTINKEKLLVKASEAKFESVFNFPRSMFPVILLMHNNDIKFFGWDTGAKKSWINETLVEKDHLKVKAYKNKKNLGAHGSYIHKISVIKAYQLDFLDFNVKFKNLETGFTGLLNDFDLDGVMGIDILKKHSIEVSNSKGFIRLIANKNKI